MSVAPLRGGPARQAELLGAVLDVLRETGYDRLTVDAVVARARASKQTVYRRWPSKADLVVAAFLNVMADVPELQDAGCLREDLLALLDVICRELADLSDIIAGLLGEAHRNPELAAAMCNGYFDARVRFARNLFDRARARGEVADDVDLDLLRQLAPAMIFFRVLLARESVDHDLLRRLVDHVIIPLAAGTATGSPGEVPGPA